MKDEKIEVIEAEEFDEIEAEVGEEVTLAQDDTKKPNIFKRGFNYVKDHKKTILKAAGVVAVGIVGYVVGAKLNRHDEDEDNDSVGQLEFYDRDDDDESYDSTEDDTFESDDEDETDEEAV